jgi:3',5'-cyclic AMP phosphodiesterase CpdA
MPAHQLSRRTFLKVVPLGIGGSLVRVLSADESQTPRGESNRLALTADVHVAEDEAREKRGTNMATNLKVVLRDIRQQRVDHMLLIGDAACDAGEPGDYATLKRMLRPMQDVPIHMTLGNHDHRENFFAAFKPPIDAPLAPEKQVTVLETPWVNWVMLDSLERVNRAPGQFGPAQLEWLDKALTKMGDKPVIICGHHNPSLGNPDAPNPNALTGLRDIEDFQKVLARHEKVKAYCCGHTHVWRNWTDDRGFQYINLPPVAWVFKVEKPQGWLLAEVNKDRVVLTIRSINPGHSAHGEQVSIKLA